MKTQRRAAPTLDVRAQDTSRKADATDNSLAQEQLPDQATSSGPFDSPLLNLALEASFGQSLSSVSADWAQEENEAIGADASCEGSAMSFGGGISESPVDGTSMEVIAHEVAHALAGGGSGETMLDTEQDAGEAKADAAGTQFRAWAESGFQGAAPDLEAASGGKATIHRHGGKGNVTGRPALRRGSTGWQVRALQSLLNAHGQRLATDASFGPRTEAGVLNFQRAAGIAADGVVGPQTAGRLNSPTHSGEVASPSPSNGAALTGDPELSFNSRGAMVSALQTALNGRGAELTVDGVFGAGTDNAVRRFQSANGLGVDGLVGPRTAAKINDASSKDLAEDTEGGAGGGAFAGNEAYDNLRDAVIAAAESHLGTPYYWGGDGPSTFDCSGFVLYVLRQETGLVNWGDDTASGIRNRVPTAGSPRRGDLVFYRGRSGISHIEFYMGSGSRTLGASGGGSRTRGDDPNARVKYGDYSRDGRSKSFGSIEGLIQAKLGQA